jgi:hypothetical protein
MSSSPFSQDLKLLAATVHIHFLSSNIQFFVVPRLSFLAFKSKKRLLFGIWEAVSSSFNIPRSYR